MTSTINFLDILDVITKWLSGSFSPKRDACHNLAKTYNLDNMYNLVSMYNRARMENFDRLYNLAMMYIIGYIMAYTKKAKHTYLKTLMFISIDF